MEKTNCQYCGTHRDSSWAYDIKCLAGKHAYNITRNEAEILFKGAYMKNGALYIIETNEKVTNAQQLFRELKSV